MNNEAIKFEINLPDELVDRIAGRVLELMMPLLQNWHEPDQYLNVDEVSAMLGKSKGQIYQWVNNASHGLSDFPYEKAGRSLRFSKKAIRTWMKGRKNG